MLFAVFAGAFPLSLGRQEIRPQLIALVVSRLPQKKEKNMHEHDFNRVEFYSKEDLESGLQLSKGESILRNETKLIYEDINDVLELYNIKSTLTMICI